MYRARLGKCDQVSEKIKCSLAVAFKKMLKLKVLTVLGTSHCLVDSVDHKVARYRIPSKVPC